MTNTARLALACSLISLGTAGCDGPTTAPSPAPPPTVQQPPQPTPQPPSPQPPSLQPRATSIAPGNGWTRGGGWATVTGSEFQVGATVRLGNNTVQATVLDSATIRVLTPAHAAGPVDVIVTNPGGLETRLASAYVYAPPGTFNLDGDWVAHVGPDFELDLRFTVLSNVLVSVSCNGAVSPTLALTASASDGQFSFGAADGLSLVATLVSPVQAVGTINVPDMPECRAARWWADKDGDALAAGVMRLTSSSR